MIIRVFAGNVRLGMLKRLAKTVSDVTLPLLEKQKGLIMYHIGMPMEPNAAEFCVVTLWKDLDALTAFAGKRWWEAVVPGAMAELLEHVEVRHYETEPRLNSSHGTAV